MLIFSEKLRNIVILSANIGKNIKELQKQLLFFILCYACSLTVSGSFFFFGNSWCFTYR